MSLIDQPGEPPSQQAPKSALRSILPYTTALTIIVLLYVAWIMYSRHAADREAQQAAESQKDQAAKEKSAMIFGSGEVKFTTLEAHPGTIQRGDTAELCYGVLNATSVKIDPPVEQIKPSSRHCMDVAPIKTTAYTVTASDAKGTTKSLTLTINVK